jgi:hypothetical protein
MWKVKDWKVEGPPLKHAVGGPGGGGHGCEGLSEFRMRQQVPKPSSQSWPVVARSEGASELHGCGFSGCFAEKNVEACSM